MNFHGIKSARYSSTSTAIDARVVVTRDSGTVEHRRANDDIEGGGMLAFLREGGAIEAYIPSIAVPVIPSSCTPLQARNQLRSMGITKAVISGFFEALPSDKREAAEDAWEYANTIDRDNAFLKAFATALHYTEADIDAFMVSASKL